MRWRAFGAADKRQSRNQRTMTRRCWSLSFFSWFFKECQSIKQNKTTKKKSSLQGGGSKRTGILHHAARHSTQKSAQQTGMRSAAKPTLPDQHVPTQEEPGEMVATGPTFCVAALNKMLTRKISVVTSLPIMNSFHPSLRQSSLRKALSVPLSPSSLFALSLMNLVAQGAGG